MNINFTSYALAASILRCRICEYRSYIDFIDVNLRLGTVVSFQQLINEFTARVSLTVSFSNFIFAIDELLNAYDISLQLLRSSVFPVIIKLSPFAGHSDSNACSSVSAEWVSRPVIF